MFTQATTAPPVEAELIDVYGTSVALRQRGKGRPLVYLHGVGMTGRWLRIHEALAGGARVIAPEHIGFGATPMQGWLRGFDDLVIHYDDVRRVLGLDEPFDLVGYSLGGWLAAEYAVTYPDQVRSLTLIAPAGLPLPGKPPVLADLFGMDPDRLAATIFNDPTNIGEIMVDLTDLDTVVQLYEERSAAARLVWQRPYSARLPRLLRRVSCPTLVVGAEQDRLVPDEVSDQYARLIPHATLTRVPGTGHALIIERPEAVAAPILDFLEGLS